MKASEVKRYLADIARPRPTLMGLLQKDVGGGQTLGSLWASILADPSKTRPTYLEDVLGEFADRVRMIPERIDELCDVIQSEANARHYREWEKHLTYQRYIKRPERDFADDELGRFFAVLDKIRREPNKWRERRQAFTDVQIREAVAWTHSGGEKPEMMR